MTFKVIELIVILGGLVAIWRYADGFGKRARAEEEAKKARDATTAPGADGSAEG